MPKFSRLLLLTAAAGALFASGAAAQPEPSLAAWLPADSAGYVQIDTSAPNVALGQINLALFAATTLQPTRADYTARVGFDALVPLSRFDLETAGFDTLVGPWLGDTIVIGYRAFPADFAVPDGDSLIIASARDALAAVSVLGPVLDAQDALVRTTYAGLPFYIGDQTSIAIAPEAVLIGERSFVEAALDVRAGAAASLTSSDAHTALMGEPGRGAVRIYIEGEAAGRALPILVGGGAEAAALWAAWGETAARTGDGPGAEPALTRALLGGDISALAIDLYSDTLGLTHTRADLRFQTTAADPATTADAVPVSMSEAPLAYIPRNAMAVWAAPNAHEPLRAALAFVPFSHFAGALFGGFPILPSAGSTRLLAPDSTAALSVLDGFESVLAAQGASLDTALGELAGPAAAALIPRFNNPLPVLEMPFDLLIAVETDRPQAAADALIAVVERLVDAGAVADLTSDVLGIAPDTAAGPVRGLLTPEGEPLLAVGVLAGTPDVLVIATGDAFAAAAGAGAGDNRLTDQPRWDSLTRTLGRAPQVYTDLNALTATFLAGQLAGSDRLLFEYGVLSLEPIGGGRYAGSLVFTIAQ